MLCLNKHQVYGTWHLVTKLAALKSLFWGEQFSLCQLFKAEPADFQRGSFFKSNFPAPSCIFRQLFIRCNKRKYIECDSKPQVTFENFPRSAAVRIKIDTFANIVYLQSQTYDRNILGTLSTNTGSIGNLSRTSPPFQGIIRSVNFIECFHPINKLQTLSQTSACFCSSERKTYNSIDIACNNSNKSMSYLWLWQIRRTTKLSTTPHSTALTAEQ